MRVFRCCLAAAAAALLGCAAGAAPPPPVYAVRTASVPLTGRWEQFCEQATSVQQASWLAASRGADGWELVGMSNGVLCYKRPEPARPLDAPPAPAPPSEAIVRAPVPARGPVTSGAPNPVPKILDPGF